MEKDARRGRSLIGSSPAFLGGMADPPAIMFRFWPGLSGSRNQARWSGLPEGFAKSPRVYCQFGFWTVARLRNSFLDTLNKSEAMPDQIQMTDSPIIRAHHQAAGTKEGTGREGFDRSKGAFTAKTNLVVNAHDVPMTVEIRGPEVSDGKGGLSFSRPGPTERRPNPSIASPTPRESMSRVASTR